MFEAANYMEAAFWGAIGAVFLFAGRFSRSKRLTCGLVGVLFVAFGASDVTEARTGAWWHPWWLLIWKAGCVFALLALCLRHFGFFSRPKWPLLTGVAILLATAALGVVSKWHEIGFCIGGDSSALEVTLCRGELVVRDLIAGPGPWSSYWIARSTNWPNIFFQWPRVEGYVYGSTLLYLPLWIPLALLLAAILGTLARILVAHIRRPHPGHCAVCGYNLTGNVSGRCPECGTAVA